ncbi:hypothetical protein L0337_18830 [candidate division KSB1 bacterium]|nr:hypothetical protein [candidate division KSB1 bacterium]
MKVITYRVILLEPTLVTALEGEPNSAVAFNYLPGSVLRGAVIAKYIQNKKANKPNYELGAADAEVRRLFFDGTTRYLNGYLLGGEKRTLPAPVSWQRRKDDQETIYDFALEHPEEKVKWESLGEKFCALSDDAANLLQPNRQLAVHTARNRRFGRPQERARVREGEDPGAIYRYEALSPEQTFVAVILCDHDSDVEILRPLLAEGTTLGGSRSGGYGRTQFHDTQDVSDNWREVDGELVPDVDGKLVVTLLSDALLRDDNGQYVVNKDVVKKAISERLGKVVLNSQEPFIRGQEIGGFNRKWGLPLPQALAVQRGSVFVFQSPHCPLDKLHELETKGIGERRVEGFGRVAVNWQKEPKLRVDERKHISDMTDKTLSSNTTSGQFAARMAKRLLQQRLDLLLTERANSLGKHIKQPSKSQLYRLRAIIQDSLQEIPTEPTSEMPQILARERKRLADYLNDVERRKVASKQFASDRVDNKPLIEWLRERIADTTKIWEQLKVGVPPKVGGVTTELSPEMAYEYNLRLIDRTLARAAKEKQNVRR